MWQYAHHRMAHEEQGHSGIRLLSDTYGPFDIENLVGVVRLTVDCVSRLLLVESCATKAALVEGEDEKPFVGPSPMDILVAPHVFCKAMNEDEGGSRGARRRLV
jgi:hypothetical protein